MTDPTTTPRRLRDVPGWLTQADQLLFEWLLTWQSSTQAQGDAVELGVYQGKSAIHLARFLQPGERFTVCDLFDDARSEPGIRADARNAYRTLSQETFEKNYLDFHPELPKVIRGLTSVIEEYVEPATCRFVHIDASHMYEHVRADAMAARRMLRPDGIVVFDDYRTEHTIGTAAAVWEAILSGGLQPICASSMKMYGTWGDPAPAQAELMRRLAERSDYKADIQYVDGGRELIRVVAVPKPAPAKPKESAAIEVAKADQILALTKTVLAKVERPSFAERVARRVTRSAQAKLAPLRKSR